jgi:hypothetical protein
MFARFKLGFSDGAVIGSLREDWRRCSASIAASCAFFFNSASYRDARSALMDFLAK